MKPLCVLSWQNPGLQKKIFLFSACDDCKQSEDAAAQKAALEEKDVALEFRLAKLESEPATPEKAEPPAAADECAAKLAACEQHLAKCEKDPFTGTKYLTGDEEKKKK